MPIPGIVASGKLGHLSVPNNYTSIATISPSGLNSFSFNSIPQTYTHLQVRMSGGISSGPVGVTLRMNGDSGANYSYHAIGGTGTSAYAENSINQTVGQNILYWNSYSAGIVDILDYTSTNKNKVTRGLFGWDSNGSGYIIEGSDMWYPSTPTAVTSLTFTIGNGSYTFTSGTTFALYGVK